MTETTNFGLKKPEENDFYDFETQNENLDAIDRIMQECKEGTENISSLTTNLLNVTIPTTTKEGVTLTNNGDGSFVLGGASTNTNSTYFKQTLNVNLKSGTSYKFLGATDENGGRNIYKHFLVVDGVGYSQWKQSDEVIITPTKDISSVEYQIECGYGVSLSDVVFKPMLTTNLEATLDDFVPYTGSTGALNGDVAEIRKTYFSPHNKPTGTYTGNGSATERVIETGGIGHFAVVWANGTNNDAITLLTTRGGYVKKGNTISGLSRELGRFQAGSIYMSTTDLALNQNGVTYQYEVH